MHTQQFRRPAVIGIQLRSQSGCSFQCHQISPISSTSTQNRGAQASTTCQTLSRAAGICAQPSVSCLPSSLIRLRDFGQCRIRGCRHYQQRRLIVATAIHPQTAEPLRKQRRWHSSQERPLLTRHWCWEWGSSRWRASLFFLLASIAFFGASTAAMLEPVASNLALSSALVAYPYAAGSVLFTLGARQYKRAALEGLRAVRRRHGKEQPACAWARVEVKGTQAIVAGCQMGVVSTSAPILLGALPSALPPALLTSAEAWLTSALNTVSGLLFVVGSYVILGSMYGSMAPGVIFARQHLREWAFWGSACYLVGSAGLLLAAVLTQPLLPFVPELAWWGHVIGYVIGSLWFTAGALAQIADVARERMPSTDAQMIP